MADSVAAPAWVAGLSPFEHLALVPTTSPDVLAALVMAAIAVGIGMIGVVGYRRRDIRGE